MDTLGLSSLVTWDSTVGSERLTALKPAEFEKVTEDLENLQKFGLIDCKKKKGYYEQISHSNKQYDDVYVYSHGGHSSFSKMSFDSVAQLCDVRLLLQTQ